MIREARSEDKKFILNFCKDTFSWGDYIKDIWDYWLSEGFLFVAEDITPVGICHAVFINNQVWIEGIRVDPKYRRKGIASNLVKNTESISKSKKILSSFMLIDSENIPSLSMAKTLNYEIFQTWNFYTLTSKKNLNYKISFGNVIPKTESFQYVKSWRWIPLDQNKIELLNTKNCIIYCGENDKKTIGILEDSEHFSNTLIVTVFAGDKKNTINLLSYLQNYGFNKKYHRIQILTKELLPYFDGLDLRISFHLMQKLLS